MDSAVANTIVTAATGLAAPAVPAAPAAAAAAGAAAPVVVTTPKSRDEVVRALADGKTEAQGESTIAKNADNANTSGAVVDVAEPNADGAAATVVTSDGAAAADTAGADTAAAPDAPVALSQEQLEQGTDVGTGDALFRIRDKATGQWKASPTDVVEVAIRDAATGEVKTYEKTIPELVRMARDGVAGQKLVPEVKYYRDNVGKWKDSATQLQQRLDAQMQLNREILSSEEKYLERAAQYAQEMAPDKRAERLQAQLNARAAQDARQAASQQLAQQVNGFYTTRIQPVVAEALKALPPEMVIGRINADTLPLMVNGVIPPQHWPQYEAYVRGPFATWAKNEGAKWTQNATARDVAAKAATDAQKATQKAKQDQARTMAPIGKTAATAITAEPVKLPPPKNKREAMERLVSRPLEG